MKTISRYIMTLALLITAAAGAWATPNSIVINGTPLVGDKSISLTYYFDPANFVPSLEPYAPTLKVKCAADNKWDEILLSLSDVSSGTTNISLTTLGEFEAGKTYEVCFAYNNGSWVDEVFQSFVPAAPTGPAVTIADGNGEASFKMPQYDVTATYTIKRDMTVDVAGEMADRIRIKKDGNEFQAVDATQMNPVVKDKLDAEHPVTMTVTTDYTLQLQKQGETEDSWTDVTAYSVGTFRYKITGAGNYSGICYSEEFALFQGYEVTVPADEYVTYFKDEALYVEDTDAKLYTITAVSGSTATADELTIAPANTPILVKNNSGATKTIVLIPTETTNTVTVADEFIGTLTGATIAASTTTQNNYAFNGKEFVWVKNDIAISANKAWLQVTATASAAPQIRLIFSSTTGIESVDREQSTVDGWYDLNGRRLPGKPTKKGVYIVNGKKMVVK